MQKLRNLTVSLKLTILIIVAVIGLIIIVLTGYLGLKKTQMNMHNMYTNNVAAIQNINSSVLDNWKIQTRALHTIIITDPADLQQKYSDLQQYISDFETVWGQYKQNVSPDKKDAVAKTQQDWLTFKAAMLHVAELGKAGEKVQANAYYQTEGWPAMVKLRDDLFALNDAEMETMKKANDDNAIAAARSIYTMLITAVIIAALLVLFGIWLMKDIITPLKTMMDVCEKLSKGDYRLVKNTKPIRKDEFGKMATALLNAQLSVRKMVKMTQDSTADLSDSSGSLTATTEQLAQAANQTAVSITEVSKGTENQLSLTNQANNMVHEIAGSLEKASDNIKTVFSAAEDSSKTADEGSGNITRAVEQMNVIEQKTNDAVLVIGDLKEKSNQIGKIVELISSIAEQTNLLALNAAIEAARAGESGKGFAVVAEEVRKLAEESAQATGRITDLINSVQEKTNNAVSYMDTNSKEVAAGADIVSKAGESFKKISGMVENITQQVKTASDVMDNVSQNSQRIAGLVDNITKENKNTAEQTQTISAATEQQSASAEEMASASRQLSDMAEKLKAEVGKFTL